MSPWLVLPPSARFDAGSTTLVYGPSGAGKSGLLLALAGLLHEARGVPSPWTGLEDPKHPLATAYARGHGALLFQNPADGLCTDRVADELAMAMESCGMAPEAMHQAIAEWTKRLGLADHAQSPVGTLSGGYQQRLAMGALLCSDPEVLLIDEALSQLDYQAQGYLLASYDTWRSRHPQGVAVIVEHRPELWAGRFSQALRWMDGAWELGGPPEPATSPRPWTTPRYPTQAGPEQPSTKGESPCVLIVEDVVPGRTGAPGWSWPEGLSISLAPGFIVALVGPNGGGKSTLLQTFAGLVRPTRGGVRANKPAMALQNPELQFGPGLVADHDPSPDFTGIPYNASPHALSLGQQRRLSLSMLPKDTLVYLLDEPFYGQDAASVQAVIAWLHAQCSRGAAIVLSCHDLDLAWVIAHRVIHVDKSGWHHPAPPATIQPWWQGALA